ncbi:hypothetical protein ACMD2_00773 [Ananas comosus]|uniref:Uncharacterized protein n=1 Tax=Ananas comosus TaxID=4615 RepID=A0A199V4H7_ANACO|nr:hypothetical protein ACMD2_00773 [Ananas comosus]
MPSPLLSSSSVLPPLAASRLWKTSSTTLSTSSAASHSPSRSVTVTVTVGMNGGRATVSRDSQSTPLKNSCCLMAWGAMRFRGSLSRRRAMRWRNGFRVLGEDAVEGLFPILPPEGGAPVEHLVEHHPQAPPVHREIVALPSDDLRRHFDFPGDLAGDAPPPDASPATAGDGDEEGDGDGSSGDTPASQEKQLRRGRFFFFLFFLSFSSVLAEEGSGGGGGGGGGLDRSGGGGGEGSFVERSKSTSMRWPLSWMRTFSGLRSRYTIPSPWRCSSARTSSAAALPYDVVGEHLLGLAPPERVQVASGAPIDGEPDDPLRGDDAAEGRQERVAERLEHVALEPDPAIGVSSSIAAAAAVALGVLDGGAGDGLEGERLPTGGGLDEEDDALGPAAEDGERSKLRQIQRRRRRSVEHRRGGAPRRRRRRRRSRR